MYEINVKFPEDRNCVINLRNANKNYTIMLKELTRGFDKAKCEFTIISNVVARACGIIALDTAEMYSLEIGKPLPGIVTILKEVYYNKQNSLIERHNHYRSLTYFNFIQGLEHSVS